MTESGQNTNVSRSFGSQPFRIGDALVDPVTRTLTADNETTILEHKTMAVLRFLAERAHTGEVVKNQDIVTHVWPKSSAGDTAVHRPISLIRAALGDEKSKYIETITKQGYRITVDVVEENPTPTDAVEQSWKARLLVGGVAGLSLLVALYLWQTPKAGFVTDDKPSYSLAVLKFRSGNSLPVEFEGVAQNISEELILALGTLDDFEVVARSTSFSPSYSEANAIELGETLKVDYIVDGRVEALNDEIRVVVEMAETQHGRHHWGNEFRYSPDGLYVASGEIAEEVVRALEVVLGTQGQESIDSIKAQNPQAYKAYIGGRDRLMGARDEVKLREALDLFSEALIEDTGFELAHVGICQTYVALYSIKQRVNDFEQAEIRCQRVMRNSPANAQARIALGTLYRERGDHAAAIETLKSVVDAFQRNTEALVELGDAYSSAGQMPEALETYRRAVTVAPNEYDTQAALGIYYYVNHKLEEALQHLRRAVPLNPDSPTPLNNLAATYYRLDQFEAAAQTWQKSLDIQETRVVLTNLGMAQYYLGEFELAENYHRRALKFAGFDHRILGRLAESVRFIPGRASESHDLYKKARDAAIERIASNPTDAMAHARLGNFRAHLGQEPLMRSSFEKAHELSPNARLIFYIEAVSWAALNNEAETLRCLKRAKEAGLSSRFILDDPDIATMSEFPEISHFLSTI